MRGAEVFPEEKKTAPKDAAADEGGAVPALEDLAPKKVPVCGCCEERQNCDVCKEGFLDMVLADLPPHFALRTPKDVVKRSPVCKCGESKETCSTCSEGYVEIVMKKGIAPHFKETKSVEWALERLSAEQAAEYDQMQKDKAAEEARAAKEAEDARQKAAEDEKIKAEEEKVRQEQEAAEKAAAERAEQERQQNAAIELLAEAKFSALKASLEQAAQQQMKELMESQKRELDRFKAQAAAEATAARQTAEAELAALKAQYEKPETNPKHPANDTSAATAADPIAKLMKGAINNQKNDGGDAEQPSGTPGREVKPI